jgi:spore maturation protein CgeB
MRILFCTPAADFSIADVGRGLRAALVRQGHEVKDYEISKRLAYHAAAMGPQFKENLYAVSKQASENILIEAIYHQAELVLIVSALVYHPIAMALLRWGRIRTAVVHTESPYCDDQQLEWSQAYPEALYFTNERTSARQFGWHYLPHSYDPEIHKPSRHSLAGEDYDVVFVGTGWPERIRVFEQVNWDGIRVRFYGLWPQLSVTSPLRKYYVEGLVPNHEAVRIYQRAKICLNMHRAHEGAESLNPRAYELAACGAFQISDVRQEGVELFGEAVPTFRTAAELEALIRRYLADPGGRRRCAEQARRRVKNCTFDQRLHGMMAVLEEYTRRAA